MQTQTKLAKLQSDKDALEWQLVAARTRTSELEDLMRSALCVLADISSEQPHLAHLFAQPAQATQHTTAEGTPCSRAAEEAAGEGRGGRGGKNGGGGKEGGAGSGKLSPLPKPQVVIAEEGVGGGGMLQM